MKLFFKIYFFLFFARGIMAITYKDLKYIYNTVNTIYTKGNVDINRFQRTLERFNLSSYDFQYKNHLKDLGKFNISYIYSADPTQVQGDKEEMNLQLLFIRNMVVQEYLKTIKEKEDVFSIQRTSIEQLESINRSYYEKYNNLLNQSWTIYNLNHIKSEEEGDVPFSKLQDFHMKTTGHHTLARGRFNDEISFAFTVVIGVLFLFFFLIIAVKKKPSTSTKREIIYQPQSVPQVAYVQQSPTFPQVTYVQQSPAVPQVTYVQQIQPEPTILHPPRRYQSITPVVIHPSHPHHEPLHVF